MDLAAGTMTLATGTKLGSSEIVGHCARAVWVNRIRRSRAISSLSKIASNNYLGWYPY